MVLKRHLYLTIILLCVPVSSVVQQTDTRERCETPAHLFLPGISATKHIPQQIRMDVMVVLCGQPGILKLQLQGGRLEKDW